MSAARFFATASRGVEGVLADELRELGAQSVEPARGGVAFGSDLEAAYRTCMGSRVASRVLFPLATFEAGSADALYAGVHAIEWTDHVGPERTLAVDVAGAAATNGPGTTRFVALKTKDAIVDRVREREGARPSVDKSEPDVRVNVHLAGATVTVSLDLAGRGLHRRGVGRTGGAAPLKESLAAALLRIAGWHLSWERGPLVDPMCGSGTLAVEAAWMALDVAPGLARNRIGAEGWRGHDSRLWSRIVREAKERREAARERAPRIFACDASAAAVAGARANFARAAVARVVDLSLAELSGLRAPEGPAGIVVTNPPYGERLGEPGELGALYEQLGDVLRHRFVGWTAFVLSGNRALDKRVGLKPARRHVVYNGPIECRFLEIPIADTAPTSDEGPGWRRPSAEADMLANRLRKNRRKLGREAEREGVFAYRVYDADIPEYNVAIDWYDGAVRVEEYHRPKHLRGTGGAAGVADRRLRDAVLVASDAFSVPASDVVVRVRARRGPGEQAERYGDAGVLREVREKDLRLPREPRGLPRHGPLPRRPAPPLPRPGARTRKELPEPLRAHLHGHRRCRGGWRELDHERRPLPPLPRLGREEPRAERLCRAPASPRPRRRAPRPRAFDRFVWAHPPRAADALPQQEHGRRPRRATRPREARLERRAPPHGGRRAPLHDEPSHVHARQPCARAREARRQRHHR